VTFLIRHIIYLISLVLALTIYLSKCKPETAIHATDKRQITTKLLL